MRFYYRVLKIDRKDETYMVSMPVFFQIAEAKKMTKNEVYLERSRLWSCLTGKGDNLYFPLMTKAAVHVMRSSVCLLYCTKSTLLSFF